MNRKQVNGIRNPTAILKVSAIYPIRGGQKAPPATAITRNEDPFLVNVPKSLIPSAKIVGNITDIKK
jgi:hypothetical protein